LFLISYLEVSLENHLGMNWLEPLSKPIFQSKRYQSNLITTKCSIMVSYH